MAEPRIFVINLARDTARMENMRAQLDAMGLAYERFEAVNGRSLTDAERKANYSEWSYRLFHGHAASPGEIGVSLSHRRIYEKMAAENIPWAVILEDDVTLLPQFPSVLARMETLTQGYDMVQLFSFRRPDRPATASPSDGFAIGRYSSYHASSAAYGLRLQGAVKLKRLSKVLMLSDRWCWMSALSGLKCCAIVPFPVALDEKLSSVSSVGNAIAVAKKGGPRAWRMFVLPWLNLVKLSILRARDL